MTKQRRTYSGYVRVSQTGGREGDSFISPTVQREQIEGWAKAHNVDVVMAEPELDVSGGTLDRPILNGILDRIYSGESAGIIVAKLNRLSRAGVGEALTLWKKIEDAGGEVVAIAEGIDPTTSAGKIMRSLMLTLAEIELDGLKEGWQTAKRRAVERGVFPGLAPVGYARTADRKLVINEPDADKIREAFHLSAYDKRGVHAAAEYLRDVFPDRQMTLTVVEKLLRNELYTGTMRHGTVVQKFPELEIVDRNTFVLAEPAPREREQRRGRLRDEFPLAHIATCAACGGPLTAQNAKTWRGYRCRNAKCTDRAGITAEALETFVLKAVRANPPRADHDEEVRSMRRISGASDRLTEVTEQRDAYEALDNLPAWERAVTEAQAALDAARIAAAPHRASLPSLDDPSTADKRLIFERSIKLCAVTQGRVTQSVSGVDMTAARVALTLR